mgnify:CR=1 FL=1
MNTIRFLIIILTIFPTVSFAEIEISEIMYDHEGTDTGNEWVEIHNTGSISVDLQGWAFRENEVNHGLQFQDTTIIAPGGSMVIVQNIEQFYSLYGNTISVIKSSFSLNNTGEILEIVNENDEVVDSHKYSNETGAQGDGKSLQKYEGTWGTGVPSAGKINTAQSDTTKTKEETESETEDSSSTTRPTKSDKIVEEDVRKKIKFENYYDPYISFPDVLVAHSPERFQAGVFYVKEDDRVLKLRGLYYLNFGDGTIVESGNRIDEVHRYPSSGSYMVTFEYYANRFQYEAGEPDVLYQKEVEVVATSVQIQGTDENGGIVFKNTGLKNIDMTGWTIKGTGITYTFPRLSFIRPQSTIVVSYSALGFWVNENIIQKLYLTNDSHILVHQYVPPEPVIEEVQVVSSEVSDIQLGEHTVLEEVIISEEASFEDLPVSDTVYEYIQEEEITSEPSPHYLVIGFGSLVVFTGFTRYLYVRRKVQRKKRRHHNHH